jgi:hypothetical protein
MEISLENVVALLEDDLITLALPLSDWGKLCVGD